MHAAFFDVGAGDVDFDGINWRVVEATRHFDVLIDGRTRNIRDKARFAEIKFGQDFAHDMVGARILQPDGIQHAHRRLVHTMRRIAEAR